MLYTDFCTQFNQSVQKQDVSSAYRTLMQELGRILVHDKQDFVDLLNESGYEAHLIDPDIQLVDTFADNVAHSPSLMLGASMLAAAHNRKMSFDGEDEYLDDDLVKTSYSVMYSYFGGSENYSNAAADPVTGIANAITALTEAGTTIGKGQQEKKYAGQKYAQQKEASKQQLIQGIIDAKKQQAEAAKKEQEEKAKTRRTVYIVGGAVLGILAIGVVIYAIRKRRRK